MKYDKNKTIPYKGNTAEIGSSCGVLCTWYGMIEDLIDNSQISSEFVLSTNESTTTHLYHPINTYIATLTINCLEKLSTVINTNKSIASVNQQIIQPMKNLFLTKQSTQFLTEQLTKSSPTPTPHIHWILDNQRINTPLLRVVYG